MKGFSLKDTLIDTLLTALAALFLFLGVAAATARAQSGDPSGFTDALNQKRASIGLSAVRYEPSYVGVAARNNSFQVSLGLGHHFLGGLAQCAGVGQANCQSVLADWSASPGHAAILFDPSLQAVGYHQLGTAHMVSGSSSGATAANPVVFGKSTGYPVCGKRRFFFWHKW